MTARQFIEELFRRDGPWNRGLGPDQRSLTVRQLEELRRLIGDDGGSGAVKEGMHGGFAWAPPGLWKFVVTVELRIGAQKEDKRTLMRVPSAAMLSGRLFEG